MNLSGLAASGGHSAHRMHIPLEAQNHVTQLQVSGLLVRYQIRHSITFVKSILDICITTRHTEPKSSKYLPILIPLPRSNLGHIMMLTQPTQISIQLLHPLFMRLDPFPLQSFLQSLPSLFLETSLRCGLEMSVHF